MYEQKLDTRDQFSNIDLDAGVDSSGCTFWLLRKKKTIDHQPVFDEGLSIRLMEFASINKLWVIRV